MLRKLQKNFQPNKSYNKIRTYAIRTEKINLNPEQKNEEEIEKKFSQNFLNLREKLEYKASNEHLEQALTHYSFNKLKHSARFSFIGRMALQMFTSDYLIKKYPNINETKFITIESLYTNKVTLYLLGRDHWNLENLMKTGDEFQKYIPERKKKAIADIVYSIVGSVYDQLGPIETRDFVTKNVVEIYPPMEIYQTLLRQDPLLALNQMKVSHGTHPNVLSEKLPNGKFKSSIYLFSTDRPLGEAEGNSEEEATKLAALSGLISLGKHVPDY